MDRKQSERWLSRVSRTINSTACFSLAYVILTYLLWYITGLAGRFFKFDSLVYYYGIKFMLNGHAWSKLKIVLIYSAGPLSMLLLSMLALLLYHNLKRLKTILNVFLLWIFVLGFTIFLSQIIIAALGVYRYDSLYYQGLAVTFAWLKIPAFLVYALNIFVVLFIIYIGVNSSRPFLAFSYSYSKVNNAAHRRKYFFEIALVPFIIGGLLTCVAVFPKDQAAKSVLVLLGSTHLIYLFVTGIVLGIGWLSLSYVEISRQQLVRYNSLQMPNVLFIILMFVAWAFIFATLRGVYVSS